MGTEDINMYNFLHGCIGIAHLLYMNECIMCLQLL